MNDLCIFLKKHRNSMSDWNRLCIVLISETGTFVICSISMVDQFTRLLVFSWTKVQRSRSLYNLFPDFPGFGNSHQGHFLSVSELRELREKYLSKHLILISNCSNGISSAIVLVWSQVIKGTFSSYSRWPYTIFCWCFLLILKFLEVWPCTDKALLKLE